MKIGNIKILEGGNLFLVAGPCVIESEEETLRIADHVARISEEIHIPTVFKASFDKANRSSIQSYRGPGLEKGLEILCRIREKTGLPVTSDIHETSQVAMAGDVLDLIQIPAFLCRQTDLIVSAGRTKKPLNLKKGQFMAPWDMKNAVEKARSAGAESILVTERGTTFGYNNLVVDMRSIPSLQHMGVPVIFDATHSVQKPGGLGHATGGDRNMIPTLAKAAVAAGCDGLFFETHTQPDLAMSDGPNMLEIKELKELLQVLLRIHNALKAPGK